jgi:uncharacterized protein YggT (Ycf19 family)
MTADNRHETDEHNHDRHESHPPREEHAAAERRENLAARKSARTVWIISGIIEALLAFRILLKLVAANPSSPFTQLIYGTTAPLVYPFRNLVANPSVGNGVLEFTSLIAILVYIFLTWVLIELALLLFKH